MTKEQIIQNIYQGFEDFARTTKSRRLADLAEKHPTHAHMVMLFVVDKIGQPSLKDLADKFGITPSAATQLVDGLVKEGLLEREGDSTDRRRICIKLTAAGQKKLSEFKLKRKQFISKLFEPLTVQELQQLEKIQIKLRNRMKELWQKKDQGK